MGLQHLIQLLIGFGILQGLVLAVLLLLSKRHRKQSNFILALFLLAYSFKLLLNAGMDLGIGLGYYLVSILLLSPLYYLYVISVTRLTFVWNLKHSWHFAPAVVYFGLIWLGHSFYDGVRYEMVFESRSLLLATSVLQGGAALQAIGYSVFILLELRRYRWQIEESQSNLHLLNLRWLNLLAGMFALVLCIWLFLGYADIAYFIKVFGAPSMKIAYLFWALMSLVVLAIGYYGLLRPEIFIDTIGSRLPSNPPKRLNTETLSKYKDRLLEVMKRDKPYLDQTLKLGQLSEILSWNPGLLSEVINEGTGKNFNDFVNEYRVNEFIQRLDSGEHRKLTLLAIAFDSGFNSKSTFNAVFKKFTGITPNQFRHRQATVEKIPEN